MKLILFCVLLCVTGCVTQQDPPRLSVTPPPPKAERIEVLVTKPCVAAADIPVPPKPTKVNIDKAGKRQVAAATAVDLKQQDIYIERAAAIIAACAK